MKRQYLIIIPALIVIILFSLVIYLSIFNSHAIAPVPSCDLTKHILNTPSILNITQIQNQANTSFSAKIPPLSVCALVRLSVTIGFSNLTQTPEFIQIYATYTNSFNITNLQLVSNQEAIPSSADSGVVLFQVLPNTNITIFSGEIIPSGYNAKIVLEELAHG